MGMDDAAFAGAIPGIYDRHLGPLLFAPFAREVARRVARWGPRDILETAAGTGIVTAELAHACPEARIIATDLNPDMLHVAARRLSHAPQVETRAADMQALPLDDRSVDVVVCQFGLMFAPDKVRANAEARRVLREGGRYLLVIWDRLERNPASGIVQRTLRKEYGERAPTFLERLPFGYAEPEKIEQDLHAAGFGTIIIETVALDSDPEAGPEDASLGLIEGSPLRAELEALGPDALEQAERAVRQALNADFPRALSAHVVTAVR